MYRSGGADMIWGIPIQTRTVHSDSEEDTARSEGWRTTPLDPLDHDGDGEPGSSKPRRGRPPKSKD